MARNAEKAMTTLARWRAAHLDQDGEKTKARRPYLASECTDLRQAEKWRMQIIREIARKVSQIQNAGLGEFRIRDLNDEINKLLREKAHWEVQIKDLGGPDYASIGPRMLDNEGKEVPGNRGYKYFGAARQLPGVRELFEGAVPPAPRKTRGELMKCINADYYGYRDDDDNILIPLESIAQKQAVEEALTDWNMKKERGEEEDEEEEEPTNENTAAEEETESKPPLCLFDTQETADDRRDKFIAYVPVPSQKDIEKALLDRRKAELLSRLGIFDLEDSQEVMDVEQPTGVERVDDTSQQVSGSSQRVDDTSQQVSGSNQRVDDTSQQVSRSNQRVDDTSPQVSGNSQQVDDTSQQVDNSTVTDVRGNQGVDDADVKMDDSSEQVGRTGQHVDDPCQLDGKTGPQVDDNNQKIDDARQPVDNTRLQVDEENRQIASKDSEDTAANDNEMEVSEGTEDDQKGGKSSDITSTDSDKNEKVGSTDDSSTLNKPSSPDEKMDQ